MPPSPPLSEADYDAIEAAVMETARGRWFLAEYARRNRQADTAMLLEALARLEDVVRGAAAGLRAVSTEPEAVPELAPQEPTAIARPENEPAGSVSLADEDLLDDAQAPALAPACPADALAPLRALSYEEKVALFS